MQSESVFGIVPSDWELLTLGEACAKGGGGVQTGPFGSQLHAHDYVTHGIPSIMPQNIGENRIIEDGISRITSEDANRLSRYLVKKGDIVYSRRGDVEKRALIRSTEDGWLCGTGCLRVRFGENVDSTFAAFYLGHPQIREWIVRHAHGATMPNLNTTILSKLPFIVPPLPEQKAIARVLGSLDDKIELNRRMNATLEAFAQTLFRAWFVDFEPVKANAAGVLPPGLDAQTAALFPSEFEESTLGWIPKGWEVGTLESIIDFALGGDWGKDDSISQNGKPAYCIRGADIPDLQSGGIGKMPLRYLKDSSLMKRALQDRDLVIEISGGSPTQSTGRPVLITKNLLQRHEHPIVCSNFCRMVRFKSSAFAHYIYIWMRELYSKDIFLQYENGTTGIKNFAFAVFSQQPNCLLPPENVLLEFDKMVKPIFDKMQANGEQSQTLAALRDALLPRLISGRLRVPEAMRAVEAHA